jgi:hypothetical protein
MVGDNQAARCGACQLRIEPDSQYVKQLARPALG